MAKRAVGRQEAGGGETGKEDVLSRVNAVCQAQRYSSVRTRIGPKQMEHTDSSKGSMIWQVRRGYRGKVNGGA